jgi:hypothetical protein
MLSIRKQGLGQRKNNTISLDTALECPRPGDSMSEWRQDGVKERYYE